MVFVISHLVASFWYDDVTQAPCANLNLDLLEWAGTAAVSRAHTTPCRTVCWKCPLQPLPLPIPPIAQALPNPSLLPKPRPDSRTSLSLCALCIYCLQGGPRLASNQYGSQAAPAPGYSSSWVRHFAPASALAGAGSEKAAGVVAAEDVAAEAKEGKGGELQGATVRGATDVWGDAQADVKATVVVRAAGAQLPALQAY